MNGYYGISGIGGQAAPMSTPKVQSVPFAPMGVESKAPVQPIQPSLPAPDGGGGGGGRREGESQECRSEIPVWVWLVVALASVETIALLGAVK